MLTLWRWAAVAALPLLGACSSMPISTMYKMVTLEPLEIDPQQVKFAVRTDRNAVIGEKGVVMGLSYHSEDGQVQLDEEYSVRVNHDMRPSGVLLQGQEPGEQVVIFSLSPRDAQSMRRFQQKVAKHQENGVEGSGGLSINLDEFCFKQAPTEPVLADMFMQTERADGFFVFLNNVDILEPDCDNCEIEPIPLCDQRVQQQQQQ
ncbi:hypothetical protein [uncultured Ferrimonas sp.]|uniref:hypothetical protein n=1 Tax=uncultured Ferrimonas sp. TaxID=432640 RepID=UPI00261600FE|nr:hypothetical protein [uncultured Ferrimonas sp.]